MQAVPPNSHTPASAAHIPRAASGAPLMPLPDDLPARNWGWFVLRGVLMLLVGVLAVLFPGPALFAFAVMFAAFSFMDGVFTLLSGIRRARADQPRWWPLALSGVLGILIGVAFLLFPLLGTVAYALMFLAMVIGWAAVQGVLQIAGAWRLRRCIDNEWLLIAAGALQVGLAGVLTWLLWSNPAATLLSVAWVIGFWAIVSGVLMLLLGVRLRRHLAAGQHPVG
ncbi:HdeD family acid-resistance protein [Erythrobacteraceae bacterium CFH 75059]|uniref:HdeD family acid-resistance protein n=1 Tax=Qipengyuania thermophila TaxID=2509361 RepID=UPI00101F7BC1|nr:DUF308 domain-containing protein [Qipengyuania thermophila]TCD05438.1 HdeD family acid-resistance protein [Erythrobacteraceae bacterium CFH 75059]